LKSYLVYRQMTTAALKARGQSVFLRGVLCVFPNTKEDSVTIWKSVLKQGLIAGSLGSVASALALVLAGRREAGSGAAPVNAVSHWYWGDRSLHRRQVDLPHTAMGYLTHHAASIFWATAYAAASKNSKAARTLPGIATGALATSAVACFVDYQLTPKRLTPGFEHELSRTAMAGVYAAMAAGLGAGVYLSLQAQERRLPHLDADSTKGDEGSKPAAHASASSSVAERARDNSVPGVQL
jgi:hypothetical protein